MNHQEHLYPPIAQALGRLRHARGWPYAPRTELAPPNGLPVPTPAAAALAPGPQVHGHDFLRILPEPALTGELLPQVAVPEPVRERPRVYWFDL